jgi:hypothetical protein
MKNSKNNIVGSKVGFLEKIEHNWLEIAAAALLALATIMSAWSAYNASRWHDRSTAFYDSADAARVESSERLTEMIQDRIIDAEVFMNYINALASGDAVLAEAYRARMNPRLKDAMDAWLRLNPLTSIKTNTR